MTDMLSDPHTYKIIHHDPIKRLSQELHILLTRWKNKEFIDIHTYRNLHTTDGLLPRAYGLPKIHKQGHPLRIIVSSIGNPLYSLSNYLHNIIKSSIPTPLSFIKNSYHLVRKLSGITLDSQLELTSLDVVSLFINGDETSIIYNPFELVYERIIKKWEMISTNTAIPIEEFLSATRLILNSTFFSFNHINYKQIFGISYGFPPFPRNL